MMLMSTASTKRFFPILRRHGGRFVSYDDQPVVLEGDYQAGRTVMLEFDSRDELMTWWNSSDYRKLAAHHHSSTATHAVYFLGASM